MARSLNLAAAVALVLAGPACAQTPDIFEGHDPAARYGSYTLAEAVRHAPHITVLEVDRVDRKRGVIGYRKVATLKGRLKAKSERHVIGTDHARKRTLLAWARPGRRAICFHLDLGRWVCVGNCWYGCDLDRATESPDASVFTEPSVVYVGSVGRLVQHIKDLLAGKEVVVTAATRWGLDVLDPCSSPVERDWLRGQKGRVCRVRVRPFRTSERFAPWSMIQPGRLRDFVGWGMTEPGGVPGLAAALKSKDSLERAEAAEDLGQLGGHARSALPALRQALRDADPFVRVYAAEAIHRIVRARPFTVLLSALKDHQPTVRVAACAALAELGRDARPAVPAPVTALSDGDERVRCAAAWALGEVSLSSAVSERLKVAEGLGRVLRHDAHASARYWSARALLKLGADAWAAAPALDAALRDDKRIALVAVHVLSRLNPPAVHPLSTAYTDPACQIRESIAESLGLLGARARLALPALLRSPEEVASLEWGTAGRAVARIDHKRLPREVLLGSLRQSAKLAGGGTLDATTLELLSPFARESAVARKAFRVLLNDKEGRFPVTAAVALARAGHAPQAVADLVKLLGHKQGYVRYGAAHGLTRLGPQARAAIPALRRAAGERGYVGDMARVALRLVKEDNRPGWGNCLARQALLGLLSVSERGVPFRPRFDESEQEGQLLELERDAYQVSLAVEEVQGILLDEDNIVPRLKQFLGAASVYRRAAAALALSHLERRSPQAVPVLLDALEERPGLLLFLADAIAGLGPRARELAPWLTSRLHHPSRAVYLAAAKALRGIDPEAAAEVWSVSAHHRGRRLSAGELEAYWHLLANRIAAEGYRATCGLIGAGEPAIAFLTERLHPVVSVGRERLKRLIADLDSNRFSFRERAAAELETLREAAEPALREALRGRPSLETRRRLEQLIAQLDPDLSGVGMRLLRSVEILEQAGTPRAKEVLKALASGLPQARLTQEAKAALARLGEPPLTAPEKK